VAMQAMRARRIKTPRLKITPTETETGPANVVSADHPDPHYGQVLLANAFATADDDFLAEVMTQLYGASTKDSQASEQRLNFMVAVIKGIKPQDQLETMLAAQMAAVHSLTMEFASRLANAGDLAWRDSAERTLNKLARTFAVQVEALKRYRTGGEQKVTVQHVSVSDGGQAIVGNVTQAGTGVPEKPQSTS